MTSGTLQWHADTSAVGDMRARPGDIQGYVDRDGVKIAYEVSGAGPHTILLAPTFPIVDSGLWKAQQPYLSRHFRVITIDPVGNGRSDRPETVEAYEDVRCADDLVAVLDAAGVDRAVVVGHCTGAWWSAIAAARHPSRFSGLVAIAPFVPHLAPPLPARAVYDFEAVLDTTDGWAKYNTHFWRRDYRGFAEFFFATLATEPHSTKQIEDGVGWALQSDAETLIRSKLAKSYVDNAGECEAMLRSIQCPVIVVYGGQDTCQPYERSSRFAELTGGDLVFAEDSGHLIQGRSPVAMNHWIRDFANRVSRDDDGARLAAPVRTQWTRPVNRPRRALYLCSPIGLGHARRDIAIATELRRLRPDLQIDWLAQHPVTALLEAHGERVHPASAWLANESAHVESEAGEHDLHAFQALRRMDEILVNNFMVFDDLVREEPYDLWIGDEAWDLDYFLHENPALKRAAYAWLTDFVGILPTPEGGAAEAALSADYNAEMLEQIARFPRLRDRSLFIGDPEDVVPDDFGEGLPSIRDWTGKVFDFTGYVMGYPPSDVDDRHGLRTEFGFGPDERVCVVSVGGSGVGGHLLRRVMASYPATARAVPGLRMVAVTGPRIDPASLDAPAGVEVRGFVPDLHRLLAACDVAVVQGGLTTTMELAATGRPFIYVPLRRHFEQNRHVRHRLERHRAGRCLPYEELDPDTFAAAAVAELGRTVDYLPVPTDGAARAAARLAELL
jgi:pimeloyl-ACP methyl ester carboxylesterase/predicted glycosyltransferase